MLANCYHNSLTLAVEKNLTSIAFPAISTGVYGYPPEEAARERGVRAELLVMSPSANQLARVAELIAAGDVRVEIAEVFPLAEIQRAHELSESGHTRGKIILAVAS